MSKKIKDSIIDFYYKKVFEPYIKEHGIDNLREKLYFGINPVSYGSLNYRIQEALSGKIIEPNTFRDNIWAEYLQIPKNKRRLDYATDIIDSNYKPTINNENIEKFRALDLFNYEKQNIIDNAPLKYNENKVSNVLGVYFNDHTIGRGFDNKGEYVSYYDEWDISPVGKQHNQKDQSRGIGKPIYFYDRIYLDDFYNIPEKDRGNPYIIPATIIAENKSNNKKEYGGMKKQKRIVPNVVRGGVAIPLGANYFLMKGKTHEQGGIDIGKDLEVENGELIRLDKNNMTIVSNAPIMNGISPAEYALGGLKDGTFVDRFKQGFKYQEKYKDINRLKDDGTKAKIGKEKTIDEMNSKMLYVPKKEPEVIINPPFLEGQVYKEIKDYIGGSPTQARKKAFNKMPRIKEKIIELANTYGVDKNLLAHRLTKEGWIDKRIQEYNKTGSLKQRDFWDKAILREVNAFEDLGLDDAATNLAKGNYNMRNELPFWTIDADNEKGRKVYSIVANSLFDALEFQAADMEYRKNELLKRGYPEENINTYINAAYNLGLYHKDLDDAEWINKTYAVPNYYELGGKTNMNKNDRNVPSTGKKIKASLGIELNKVKNRIDIPKNNRVIKITPELKLLSPEPLKPTSEQKRNLAIAKTKDFIKNNIDGIGDFTNALVGVGSSIASNRINNKMLNGLEELPEITPFVPLGNTKLKTSYNIHPQLAKARKIANRLNKYVDRNTSSSQTAINRRRQNELDYLENVNTLYGQKENVETQLINQDRMLQHQIDQYNNQLVNQDIARQDTRKAENIQLRNAIAEKKAENSVALADNISSIINNMIMNRKQGRANDKTLKVMAAGFPSITKDYLKELGLI